MSNLLEKSSLVLTPTAYDNGKLLSVKPTDGIGDFDFTRNSSATRVNELGLVEDVQILSSNLVSNGDFSQEGSELVTNGSFDTDSDWTKQTSWSISGGAANYDFLSDAKYIRQTLLSGGFVAGKAYKINFEITSGTAYMNVSSNGGGLISLNTYSVGSYSIYVTASASGSDLLIYGRNTSGTAFSIDNVSVKEVGQNWLFQNGWNMGDGVAVYSGTVSAYRTIYQENVLTVNSKYRLTFDIVSIASGSIENISQSSPTSYNTVGTKTEDFIANNTDLFLKPTADADLTIDNISVIEITDDTNLPRIDYTDGVGSWLFEPQSTNLITYSEDFSQSYWRKDKITVTDNSIISPSGQLDASLIQETVYTSGIPSLDLSNSITLSGTYTYTFYVKNNNGRYLGISFGSNAERIRTNFDFNTNTFKTLIFNGTTTGLASFTNLGDYYRISITATFPSSTVADIVLMPLATDTYPFFDFQNSDNRSFYLWGAQLEQSSFATSYIPTNGEVGGVTRLQDAAFGAGSSDLINSTEGVLYAEIATLVNGGVNRYISLSDNTTSNRLNVIFSSNTDRLTISGVGDIGGFTNINFLSYTQNVYNKIAIKYSSSGVKLFVNGSLEGSNSDNVSWASNTLTTLDFTLWNQSTAPFEGKIKCVAVFKEALTDEELTCLTTI